MSRRKVLAALARHGCEVLRDTGGHTVFVCPCGHGGGIKWREERR